MCAILNSTFVLIPTINQQLELRNEPTQASIEPFQFICSPLSAAHARASYKLTPFWIVETYQLTVVPRKSAVSYRKLRIHVLVCSR